MEEEGSIYGELPNHPTASASAPNVWAEEMSFNRKEDEHMPQPLRPGRGKTSEEQSLVQPPLPSSRGNITPRTSCDSQTSSHNLATVASAPDSMHPTSDPKHTPSPSNPFRRDQYIRSEAVDLNIPQQRDSAQSRDESNVEPLAANIGGPPFLEYQPSTEPWGHFASAPPQLHTGAPDPWSREDASHAIHTPQEKPPLDELDSRQAGDVNSSRPEKACQDPAHDSVLNAPELLAHSKTGMNAPKSPTGDTSKPNNLLTSHTRSNESPKRRRASETYQIRIVNWYDASSSKNPRRSPIMVQNANGPCPLLALINALVLSTPSDLTTVLVETLRVREQVSLGLLLDAVIDELMSGRRGDAAQNLPDVSELYAFLVTLHTGMNVNPRFVAPEETPINLMDAPVDMPTSLNDLRKPGGFEDTKEMKLYSTFAVPLIHGWIPPRNHPAFAALKRAARTYEDAQNIMFREEELEAKLKGQGLSAEEQVMLEDIGSLKYFLSSTATQLTGYGLDTITESLAPGKVAILFRNDHFSTLYRHPKSGQLLTLVTDMGYAGHDEVVWESLVDVSGEGCEFFAGDFRPVGNIAGENQQQNAPPGHIDEEGWETVSRKPRKQTRTDSIAPQALSSALPPLEDLHLKDSQTTTAAANTEQEDHDLALAMQLQEEEEERSRRDAAARRREDELSQAYLNNADSSGRRTFPGFGRGATGANAPTVPPRGGRLNSNRVAVGRSASEAQQQSTRRHNTSEDAPPPSYEQAAKGPAYHPPVNHPAHPHASPSPNSTATTATRPQMGRNRQGSSAYAEHVAAYNSTQAANIPPRRGGQGRGRYSTGAGQLEGAPGVVRRRSDMVGLGAEEGERVKDKECTVM